MKTAFLTKFYGVLSLAVLLWGMFTVTTVAPVRADSPQADTASIWVGNMFPYGKSETVLTGEEALTVYTQVYHLGVTRPSGQGQGLYCKLVWSEVDVFGGVWKGRHETPMSYRGDIGDNDEYAASILPAPGLYEFTTRCQDQTGTIVWQPSGNGRLEVSPVLTKPKDRRALWLSQSLLAWNTYGGAIYELHYGTEGNLSVPIRSGSGIQLRFDHTAGWNEFPKFPNLQGYDLWYLPSNYWDLIPELVKSEVAIAAYDRSGQLIDATGVQIQGVLDDLYSYSGDLGVVYNDGIPSLKLWAPTARSIKVWRYKDAISVTPIAIEPMIPDPDTGVWSLTGDASWDRQYYIYEVEVFVPYSDQVEHNFVTDPYSVNLAQNSRRSQIVDLYGDDRLKPEGWDTLVKPVLEAPEDIAIYEVHVRDFSRDDPSVAPEHRGTFKAFTYDGQGDRPPLSFGMNHLIELAKAGLTHIHLLPVFDFSSVDEEIRFRVDPSYETLGLFPPNSLEQQSIVGTSRNNDSFNWGYDPYHYGVPEGSYATHPEDTSRILEFREMVKVLAENNLQVVMDMVYNHTFASGLYTQAVLDKVVPGYYHRYDNAGVIQSSSCCADTAAEMEMMQKLMEDTLVRWAKAYKVDSFRFDLMNLHPVNAMERVRDALHALTPEADGVDGSHIYLYGEGWDFGSAKDKGLYYANQYNMAGTGIGTFNDKIRDAIHGGYSEDSTEIREQGFVNGQSYDWNGHFYRHRFRSDARATMDRLRVNLAGSLQDYYLWDQNNNYVAGIQLEGSGYAFDPQETVNYCSKHDNETLYDLNVFKLPKGQSGMEVLSLNDRIRVQNLALSIVGLSQGIPFFHMGSDMLRSKSLDRNSYDSGDWFNRVDFQYETNNFGVGLPPAWNNQSRWGIMSPLLADPALNPDQEDILKSVHHLREILSIRKSSKLFRLETGDDIRTKVGFYNLGSNQREGLIILSIDDTKGHKVDDHYDQVLVFFNADKFPKDISINEFAGESFELHPIQAQSYDEFVQQAKFDPASGTFTIPYRTAAVFVKPSQSIAD
ncbi:MAG: pullulanase-type alpha-1,6-glucosidase [Prochlorotrichaceae cyanobacterium]